METQHYEAIVAPEAVMQVAISELNMRARDRLGMALLSAVGGGVSGGLFAVTSMIPPPPNEHGMAFVNFFRTVGGVAAVAFGGIGGKSVLGAFADKRLAHNLQKDSSDKPLADLIPNELAVRISRVALENQLNGANSAEAKKSLLHAMSIQLPEGTSLSGERRVKVVMLDSLDKREQLEKGLPDRLKRDDAMIIDTSFRVERKGEEGTTVFRFADKDQWTHSEFHNRRKDVITQDALLAHNGVPMGNDSIREVMFTHRRLDDWWDDSTRGVSGVGVRYPTCVILDREVSKAGGTDVSHELVVGLTEHALLSLVGIGSVKS
ncbi:hypothetical protein HY029_02360 [Candidatus Gottesmanbacteria bacterium]|nr:hypothetical protein [Candidatus Gottesmanbacteria bacterium]